MTTFQTLSAHVSARFWMRTYEKRSMIVILLSVVLMICGSACSANGSNKKNDKMKASELTKNEFLKKVYDFENHPSEWKYSGDKPALIDLYATWCGPCRAVASIIDELAAEYADSIVFYKIDTEKEPELAALFGVRAIPTLVFVPMQGKPHAVQGAMGKADFKKAIDTYLLGK